MRNLRLIFAALWLLVASVSMAQELNATVEINTQHIQGTNKSVFDNLKTTLTQFMNDRRWTGQRYNTNERIKCTISIIVNKYKEESGLMTCEAYIQSSRPVFNSSYLTTTLSVHDANFNFEFHEFDQLEFREDQIDNNLVALMAYYAYLIIGTDLDTMSPEGGTDAYQMALTIANNSQMLNTKGWKAFDDERNRFGIINDLLDASMQPFRQLNYDYHRQGLDKMAENVDAARESITKSIDLLKTARANKSRSALPMLFTEYKRDELVSIYQGQETSAKKQPVYDILVKVNASQSNYWKKILE